MATEDLKGEAVLPIRWAPKFDDRIPRSPTEPADERARRSFDLSIRPILEHFARMGIIEGFEVLRSPEWRP